jgi:hypothetical protein
VVPEVGARTKIMPLLQKQEVEDKKERMKSILFRKLYKEPSFMGCEETGYQIFRGSKKYDGGKDIIAHCDTLAEVHELIQQLKDIEDDSMKLQ